MIADIIYLNPSTDEVLRWLRAGLCAFCGGKCPSDQCRARKCDSCTSVWIAETNADLSDGQVPQEDCPPCVHWWANLHLENPAFGQFLPSR